eukprot:2843847-Alexandrium_andersonii.AAC.1
MSASLVGSEMCIRDRLILMFCFNFLVERPKWPFFRNFGMRAAMNFRKNDFCAFPCLAGGTALKRA